MLQPLDEPIIRWMVFGGLALATLIALNPESYFRKQDRGSARPVRGLPKAFLLFCCLWAYIIYRIFGDTILAFYLRLFR